ncbi:fimbria/pilus outer membrane usher protein [Burkholderia lata]|uniref:fimbria/pilus outer membrane usher protein n=1 Tax=Burkholderia lata (strain ATCC 17760 / DSM 23089 / LMG 22485 / NCIMB 9086 / R18194 / 383) TaxID=482957 RepID=UPI00399A29FC
MVQRQYTGLPVDAALRLKPLCALLLAIIAGWQAPAEAEEGESGAMQVAQMDFAQVEFESGFFSSNDGVAIDVSRYRRGNVVRAGTYNPDIYVDGQWAGRAEVRFNAAPNTVDAQPCFDQATLEQIGIDMSRLTDDVRTVLDGEQGCVRIGQAIPEASVAFDFNELRLDLSIPQVAMVRRARGYVSPDRWTEGVPVAMLGYNVNAYHSRPNGGRSSTQGYVGLDGGFNYGRWHFRHSGSLNWGDLGPSRYENVATYLQRDLADWSSQLVVGDSYTSGDLFDSTSFRGVRVYSDDRMLPESQRGYAPVIRGIARSNAKVTVTQNSVKLLETTVAPGAFVIDDLYPTGYGGDLLVSVMEADGSVHSFSVPFASVPLSLRPGQNRFSFTAGTVRNLSNTTPWFTQATWQRGYTNMLTGFGGVSIADGYASAMIGGVLNTSWGAFGLDVTHATTRIPQDRPRSGQSYRVSFAKTLPATGTNVALAAYRYSTSGFFGLNDAMAARDLAKPGSRSTALSRQRNRASLTLSQQLGESRGSLNITASASTYWNRSGSNVDYSIGYNNSFRNLSYTVMATRQRDAWGTSSTLLYANLVVPLGRTRPATLSTSVNRDTRGTTQIQTNLSGAVGVDNNFSYGLNVNHTSAATSAQTNGGANATYRGRFAEVSGSVGASADYQQFSVGAQGAIVAHPGGVTLSQPLSETFAIVEAPHAAGARIASASGVRVDRHGYAIVPYLAPFAINDVVIDPKGLSTDVELKETSQSVAPLAGAVPMLTFKTVFGRSAVIRARQADGMPVPFGASVTNSDGKDVGVVGQAGKLFARGLERAGELTVQWEADDRKEVCRLSYSLPTRERAAGFQAQQSLDLPCVSQHARDYSPPGTGGREQVRS